MERFLFFGKTVHRMMPDKRAVGLVLLIPERANADLDAFASVWEQHGGEVLRLGRFWDPPALDVKNLRVYGGTSFVTVLQKKLGIELCTPAEDLILSLPPEALKRQIEKRRLGEIEHLQYPVFVKSVTPKLFGARVYGSLETLRKECQGLDIDTPIFTSSVVSFVAEARTFILDGKVLDCAFYEGRGNIKDAASAAAGFARSPNLPSALVLDVGLIKDQGWAVVELNAAWGAGFNGCRADRIWQCIAAASDPARAMSRKCDDPLAGVIGQKD